MWPYWLFFLLPAWQALAHAPRGYVRPDGLRAVALNTEWVFVLASLTLLIGLRFEVGGDWGSYVGYVNTAAWLSFGEALRLDDPGYWLVNVFASNLGFGIVGVNMVAGLIFATGLVVFCQSLPRPWLALAVAVPYLVIVVGMGYSRQGIALGFALLGLVSVGRNRIIWFVFWVALAATFHKSAVLLLPIAALSNSKNRFAIGALIIVATGVGYKVLLEDAVQGLITNYVDAEYQSSGAFIRLAMNALPAVIFLVLMRRFRMPLAEKNLWRTFSWISVGLLLAFFATSASTALDRMALYMIPLQLVVFAHLPDVLGKYGKRNQNIVSAILIYYSLVLFVWLNFAIHSRYWVPYMIAI